MNTIDSSDFATYPISTRHKMRQLLAIQTAANSKHKQKSIDELTAAVELVRKQLKAQQILLDIRMQEYEESNVVSLIEELMNHPAVILPYPTPTDGIHFIQRGAGQSQQVPYDPNRCVAVELTPQEVELRSRKCGSKDWTVVKLQQRIQDAASNLMFLSPAHALSNSIPWSVWTRHINDSHNYGPSAWDGEHAINGTGGCVIKLTVYIARLCDTFEPSPERPSLDDALRARRAYAETAFAIPVAIPKQAQPPVRRFQGIEPISQD